MSARSTANSPHDAPKRAADDAEIETEPLMAQVVEVVLQLLTRVGLAGAVRVLHLRPPSQPWPDQMPEVVVRNLLPQLRHVDRLLRSRTDHRLIAPQDVHYLRELIQM